jgi:hypothetical protein
LNTSLQSPILKNDTGEYYIVQNRYTACKHCILCKTHRDLRWHKYSCSMEDMSDITEDEHTEVLKCKNCTQCGKFTSSEYNNYCTLKVEFKGVFNWDIIIRLDCYFSENLLIEVKPTLGDDYPNVL